MSIVFLVAVISLLLCAALAFAGNSLFDFALRDMKSTKETDYRRSKPERVYELKKVALKLRKKSKSVKEISEITGLSDQTVRDLFKKYDKVREFIKQKYGIEWDRNAHTHSRRISSALGADSTASGKAGDEAEAGIGWDMAE